MASPDPDSALALENAQATKNPLRKLYFWTMHWAETPYALIALFVISFSESSFFPIPPDVLLLPMCFARPKKWLTYAFWCTTASVLGAIAGWFIGYFVWEMLSDFFYRWVPGFTPEAFTTFSGYYQEYGFWVILAKGLTPIPFKLITVSAGACHVPIGILIVASIISRGARFFILAGLIRLFGETIKPFIEKHLDKILLLFFILIILGFLAIKFLPH